MWQTESILLTVVTSLCTFFQYLPAILKHKHCTLFSGPVYFHTRCHTGVSDMW